MCIAFFGVASTTARQVNTTCVWLAGLRNALPILEKIPMALKLSTIASYMRRPFLEDEAGATAIEYALIASLLSLTIIAAIPLISDELFTIFETIQAAFTAALG